MLAGQKYAYTRGEVDDDEGGVVRLRWGRIPFGGGAAGGWGGVLLDWIWLGPLARRVELLRSGGCSGRAVWWPGAHRGEGVARRCVCHLRWCVGTALLTDLLLRVTFFFFSDVVCSALCGCGLLLLSVCVSDVQPFLQGRCKEEGKSSQGCIVMRTSQAVIIAVHDPAYSGGATFGKVNIEIARIADYFVESGF